MIRTFASPGDIIHEPKIAGLNIEVSYLGGKSVNAVCMKAFSGGGGGGGGGQRTLSRGKSIPLFCAPVSNYLGEVAKIKFAMLEERSDAVRLNIA